MKKVHFLTALLLVLNSLAVARIVAAVAAHRLSHSIPITAPPSTSSATRAPAEGLPAYSPILEKGLFGRATQGKLTPVTISTPATNGSASPTAGDLILVGTARGSFRETFALIRRTNPPEERVFRLGDRVFDQGTLVSVGKESVEILAGGKRVKLLAPLAVSPETDSTPAKTQTPTVAGTLQTAPGAFTIDQRALNSALENLGQVMTDARLLPSLKDGKVEGFRVSEVKPSGVFAMLGIRNGDVLHRINDLPIDSPERAIQSLAALKGQNRIRLEMTRDGQPATFSYEIR